MPRLVKDEGRGNERIVIVGEAPGANEEIQGRPFVGEAGRLLGRWMQLAGLERRDAYWTNVYPYRPQKNKIETVPRGELEEWCDKLHQRVGGLVDPVVLVPTGNTALRALVGKSKITKHRGSIYQYLDQRGRSLKVIPTIHPAAIFRQPGWERRCRRDWVRIADDVNFRELHLPEREHFIRPTLDDVRDLKWQVESRSDPLAIDIETPRKVTLVESRTKKGGVRYKKVKGERRVTVFGAALSAEFSMSIPTTLEYWHDPETLAEVWALIKAICESPSEKTLQSGHYDTWWLGQPEHRIKVRNWRWDVRWMHHVLDVLDSHGLAYMASVDTREPYWKDDGKTADEETDESDPTVDLDTWYRYNGKDCCVEWELGDKYAAQLEASGQMPYYLKHRWALFQPLLELSLHGQRMNDRARRLMSARLQAAVLTIRERLETIAGPLYAEKDISTKKLATYLYSTLKLPAQKNRQTGGVTTREVAVRKLMLRYPDKLGSPAEMDRPVSEIAHAGPLILLHRRKSKLASFIKEGIVDADGRVRSQFGFVDTARLSSGKNPRRTGANSQNTDRELLHLFIPDEGCIFLEVDLSQAEDRVVKMLTRAPRLIERARSMPWENDEHRRAASLIFHLPQDDVTKEQRYIGKRARHASNYGMRGLKLSEELMKDGYTYTPDECDRFIDLVLDKDTPEVRDWQRTTRQLVLRDRALTNSWGQIVDFTYERLNDDLYRRAYAFVPQSEVVHLLNQWGFIPLRAWLRQRRSLARINNQKHDSLLISTPPDDAWDMMCFLKEALERPRVYAGNKLTVPAEFKLGLTAAGTIEFKRFPSRDDFHDQLNGLLERGSVDPALHSRQHAESPQTLPVPRRRH